MMSKRKGMAAALLALSLWLAPYGEASMAPAAAEPVATAEPSAPAAAPAETVVPLDARASLDKAFDQLAEVKNGTYDLSLVATTPKGSATLTSGISFVSEPYTRAKGQMAIGFSLPGAPEFERDLAYYIRETEQATAFYCRLGHGEWEKSVTKRQPMDKTVNEFWTAAFRNGFMDFAKDVQFGVKEGEAQTYLVTVDGKALGKLYLENEHPNLANADMQKTLESILKNVPDFTYTVTIDEEKNTLTDFHANLTEPIRKAGLIYLKRSDMTREDKDSYRKVLENSTVELSLKGRDFNELEDVQVPAEILASARDIKAGTANANAAPAGKKADVK